MSAFINCRQHRVDRLVLEGALFFVIFYLLNFYLLVLPLEL